MLKDNLEYNKEVKPSSRDIEILKENFPHFFDKDGNFLFNKFKEMIEQKDIALNKEGYELKFLGKSYARYLSSMKTETFVSPHNTHNEKEENKNSENLYLIGDNLDALKHLLGSYAGKIKCIYIDPPYNTGSDGFVYPDNFQFDATQLADVIGIEEEEAERILNLKGKSSHSAWLTFMYPRLILARELLSDDGVIFISIDDNEQSNLKLMCDEIFGEENFVGEITVVNNPRGRDYGGIANMHEYLLAYKKSSNCLINNLRQPDKVFPFNDDIGGFEMRELRNRNVAFNKENRPNLYYPFYINENRELDNGLLEISLENKEGYVPLWPKESQGISTVWRWGKEKASEHLNINIAAKKMQDGGYMIIEKYRKSDIMARSVWNTKDDNSEKGTLLVKSLFSGKKLFDFPKSLNMIKKVIEMGTNQNSIILDFFSGSATTAHAVMQLNAEDGGNRKYILVQIPEKIGQDKPAYKAGYKTIDRIGRERIQKAAEKIKQETNANIDYGFKTYSIHNATEELIDQLHYFDENISFNLENPVSPFDTEYAQGQDVILSTYLVLDGYGLSEQAKSYQLNMYQAKLIEKSLYIIEQGITSSDVMELIRRIETLELDINRIVVYQPSILFNIHHELKQNLSNLKNNKKVELIERF